MTEKQGRTTFSYEVPTEEEVRVIALWKRMRDFNYAIVGKYVAGETVWLNAKDL